MVASQGASEAFTAQFLDDPENWSIIEQAQIFCSEVKFISMKIFILNELKGFFLVSCREAFMRVCEYAFKSGKIFAMTLSAKFICDNPIGVRLLSALPYADIVFGYEDVTLLSFFFFSLSFFLLGSQSSGQNSIKYSSLIFH